MPHHMAIDATPSGVDGHNSKLPTAVRRLASNATPSPPSATLATKAASTKASSKSRARTTAGTKSAAAAAKASASSRTTIAATANTTTTTTTAATTTATTNTSAKRERSNSTSSTGSTSSTKSASTKGKAKGKAKVKATTGSRKDKSLGLLSERFLSLYAGRKNKDICLDIVAQQLGVERRRIYDIVNVLEGLELICRKAKNCYEWLGYDGLANTLAKFKVLAPTQVAPSPATLSPGGGAVPLTSSATSSPTANTLPVGALGTSGCKPVYNEATGVRVGFAPRTSAQRQERSLGILAQRFVMLLLIEEGELVTLEEAVGRLICPGTEDTATKNKTRVRRLYDIANVLCSLKLIEKDTIRVGGSRKPAFRWNGVIPTGATGVGMVGIDAMSTSTSLAAATAAAAAAGAAAAATSVNMMHVHTSNNSTNAAIIHGNGNGSSGHLLPMTPSDASSAADSPSSVEEDEQMPARKRVRKQSLVKALDGTGSLATAQQMAEAMLRPTLPAADLTASQQAYTVKLGHGSTTMDWAMQNTQQALVYRPAPGPAISHQPLGAAGALLFAASAIDAGM